MDTRKKSFSLLQYGRGGEALEEAVQRGGGRPTHRDIQGQAQSALMEL